MNSLHQCLDPALTICTLLIQTTYLTLLMNVLETRVIILIACPVLILAIHPFPFTKFWRQPNSFYLKHRNHNCVSVSFIKQFIQNLSTPLRNVIQLSLNQGIVLIQMKIAKVIPIYKSRDRTKMDNYWQISLLNIFSKILEKNCDKQTKTLRK